MNDDKDSRFFSDEMLDKAFRPCWPAGTEIVCYCRSTDNRDTIEKIAQRGQWKIVKYIYIDGYAVAQLYKPGQVIFAVREAVEWEYKPTPIDFNEWRSQMLGGWRWLDWKITTNGIKTNKNYGRTKREKD